ncbi:MAG: phosphoribosylamine--glycine ligase [Bdellovibrionales bacterium]|nr:phosphoribosylamine--glycine ligase [Bdellovibrionales bacterium]
MKVLVIGNACREHALIQSLKEDKNIIYTLPERSSLKNIKQLPSKLLNNPKKLAFEILKEKIDLVIIGPEKPLVEGLADILRTQGIKVFGPCKKGAQLEGSKIFAKKFMKKQNIPTASYHIVSSVFETLKACENFFPPYVLKADGLAGGKGVFICENKSQLEEKSDLLFNKKALGSAGEKAILEDFQKGQEASVFVITQGTDYHILPIAQDYKRLYKKNKGPNTGGMGAVAPIFLPKEVLKLIENNIIKPTLEGLKNIQATYRGILYLGLMIHKGFPKVLEYNVRWGDPEAQVLLPLLKNSWLEVFYKTASAQTIQLTWKNKYSACVALCAENYPQNPSLGDSIKGSLSYSTNHSYFLHGALEKKKEHYFTKGGRVLNAVALGDSQEQAVQRAYKQVKHISWQGMHYRDDIGT